MSNIEQKYESGHPYESKTNDDRAPNDHGEDGDAFYHEDMGSRPSSRGSAFPSRPSTATSRPNSRGHSRPNSRQRPFSATTATSDEGEYYEDHDENELMTDHDGYAYSDLPDSRGGNDQGYDADGDGRGLFSRGTLDSRGGMYSRGTLDSRGTVGTPLGNGSGGPIHGMGRPPSGRSGMGSRPGTMGTVNTIGTLETLEGTTTSVTAGSATDEQYEQDEREVEYHDNRDRPLSSGIRNEGKQQQQASAEEMAQHEPDVSYVDPSGNFVTDDFLEEMLKERMLDSKVARTKVDALREQVKMKKQAEEAARLAREEGGGNQDGVQLLRSNAELDGTRNNTLLVRSACPEDNVEIFRPTDFLSFAGPKGYNLGGLGGLPSGGLRGMMACARLLFNCEHPRIVIEYGPVIGVSEYGEIGTVLRTDKRGSLYQRTPCPTFSQDIYDTILQSKNDDIKQPNSTMDANIRIEEESLKEMKHIASNLNIGREMSHSIEMIKSLAIQTDGLVETWARRGRSESLVLELYNSIRVQILEIIHTFHTMGSTKKRDQYSESNRMSNISIVSVGVVRIRTQIEFDDRIIPMHCEYHRKGRKTKNHLNELEHYIDEYWDKDSTDLEEEDSEDDAPPPIAGRI